MTTSNLSELILEGSMLSFDPSSGGLTTGSLPGWALWSGGELLHSGVVELPRVRDVYERYTYLADWIKEFMPVVNVLAVEKVSKNWRLVKSEGVIVGAADYDVIVPVPAASWHATLRRQGVEHSKGDEADAIAIGWHLITKASEGTL